MSFFFDVWLVDGFILASDVRLVGNSGTEFLHKIALTPPSSRIVAGIVFCGDYPENCKNYFHKAIATGDSLREIAKRFGEQWTNRYAGTSDYSAVHLVGFEKIPGGNDQVPQMWYWHNWEEAYLSKEELDQDLLSFDKFIPANNHIPTKTNYLIDPNDITTLEIELATVNNYLLERQPVFTWNGDTSFWRSALEVVHSAFSLLSKQRDEWTLKDGVTLTQACLKFITSISLLLPVSTVGVSHDGEFDLAVISRGGSKWVNRANIEE